MAQSKLNAMYRQDFFGFEARENRRRKLNIAAKVLRLRGVGLPVGKASVKSALAVLGKSIFFDRDGKQETF